MSEQTTSPGDIGASAGIALLKRIATDPAEMEHFVPATQSAEKLTAYFAGKGLALTQQEAEALRDALEAELARQDAAAGGATPIEDAELGAVAGGIGMGGGMGSGAIQKASVESLGKALLGLAGFLVSTVQSGGPIGAILKSALSDDIGRIARS